MPGWDDERDDHEREHQVDPTMTESTNELPHPDFEARDDEEPARLDLNDEERLPWLESVDDDAEEVGSDTGRLVAFLVAGLVVLAAMVGGIWWATHRDRGPELRADGSVVPAPATPYKEAPQNAGGKTFAGTGDTAYVVSEGKTRTASLATESAAPKPSVDLGAKPSTSPSGKTAAAHVPAAAPAPAPAAAGPGVQVGAYTSQASAEAGWTRLTQQGGGLLSGVKHRILQGQADFGTVYRLQAVPGDADAANALCDKLKAAGMACQVKQ